MKSIIKLLLIIHIVISSLFLLHNFSDKKSKTLNNNMIRETYKANANSNVNGQFNPDTQSDPSLTKTLSPMETVNVPPEEIESINQIISDQSTSVLEGNFKFEKLLMAIFRNGNELTASYIITNEDDTEMKLTGSIDINTASFALSNEDESITFQGLIKPGTQKGDLLTGIYKNTKEKIEVKLDLKLSHTIASTLDKRYPLVE